MFNVSVRNLFTFSLRWCVLLTVNDLSMYRLLRWHPPLGAEGLEEGEEVEADGGVFPAGRLVFRNWTQPAEVSGV